MRGLWPSRAGGEGRQMLQRSTEADNALPGSPDDLWDPIEGRFFPSRSAPCWLYHWTHLFWLVLLDSAVLTGSVRLSCSDWFCSEYASRCQMHRFECVKSCNAAVFFTLKGFLCVSRMIHHPKDIQPTWHNCGKHWSQHRPASLWNAFYTLWSPCPNELRLFWG